MRMVVEVTRENVERLALAVDIAESLSWRTWTHPTLPVTMRAAALGADLEMRIAQGQSSNAVAFGLCRAGERLSGTWDDGAEGCDRDLAVRAIYRALPLLTAHERAALSRSAAA